MPSILYPFDYEDSCQWMLLFIMTFTVNSEANSRRIGLVEQCFGSNGQVGAGVLMRANCFNVIYKHNWLIFDKHQISEKLWLLAVAFVESSTSLLIVEYLKILDLTFAVYFSDLSVGSRLCFLI